MTQDEMKKAAASAALQYIEDDSIVGVGTGSTVSYFIDALSTIKGRIQGTVSSSNRSADKLKALGIPVFDLNSVDELSIYVDGADEINSQLQMIKGGGGALTGEKIIASVARQFICIADQKKRVDVLGTFPVAIEVIRMARSAVGRSIVKLGGNPVYREGFISDQGHIILDVYDLDIVEPIRLEERLNHIPGVVTNGIFAKRPADILLLGTTEGVITFRL